MAVASKTRIANLALWHIGNTHTIESLTESSTEAAAVNLWYDHARRTTLESYDWTFARKRVALAADAEDPPSGVWSYRYLYPADCLKMRRLENATTVNQSIIRGVPIEVIEPDAIPYTIESASDGDRRTILTDLDDATAVYTFDNDDTQTYPTVFIDALSHMLASYICYGITKKQGLTEQVKQQAARVMQASMAHDANEDVRRPPRDADWIRGRY